MYRSLPSVLDISLWLLQQAENTHKMKYGHRGGNHPVKDLETGRVIFPPRTMATL